MTLDRRTKPDRARSRRVIPLCLVFLCVTFGSASSLLGRTPFLRGDANGDSLHDVSDSVFILLHLFVGNVAPSCEDALDVDDSSTVDMSDGIYGVNYLFTGGPEPPPPYGECGTDPTDDGLDCDSHAACPVEVDKFPPVIEIVSPPNLLVVGTPDLEVRGIVSDESDEISDLDVSINSIPVDPDPATGEFVATIRLGEGQNDVTAVAIDPAGNSATVTIVSVLDTSPPVIVVDSPAAGTGGEGESDLTTNEPRVTITGYLNDQGSSQSGGSVGFVSVRSTTEKGQVIVGEVIAELSGRAFVALDFPLRRGVNIIEVSGVDGVGNEAPPVTRRVTFTDIAGQRIVRLGGDGQSASILTLLPEPLSVALVDRDGRAIPNRVVHFEVVRNSGLLSTTAGIGPRSRELFVRTDTNGRAQVYLTLGDRIGAGFNRIRATAAGFQGEALFCATAVAGAPARINATQGANQTGVPGQALTTPLVAQAIDTVGNPIPGLPVTFRVIDGGGTVSQGGKSGAGAVELVVVTNDEGLASAVFHLGLQEGIYAHGVIATFEDLIGLNASFRASAIFPGVAEETTVIGTVLDNSDEPLEGVTARILDTNLFAETDDQGQFEIENAPVGTVHLLIDGSTSTREGTWPSLEFEFTTISGQENSVGEPIRLPEVDVDNALLAGGDETVVIEMDGVPGMTLTVFPNSATFPDGSSTGMISLSQVKLDKVPMPPPNGSTFMPPAWTIQPAGIIFDPPAAISIPNDGLPAGRIIDMFQFDHLLQQFVNIGTGTVVPDASVIKSDPGFGVVRAGWGGCGQPPPPQTCASSCDDGNPCTMDACVNGACVNTPITKPQTVANGCDGCDNGTRKPPKTEAQCCADDSVSGSPISNADTHGWVVCCNGKKTACVKPLPPANFPLSTVLDACAKLHEHQHFGDIDCPDKCETNRPSFKDTRPQSEGECDAYKVTIQCLRNHNCAGDATCQMNIDNYIEFYKNTANGFKAGCVP